MWVDPILDRAENGAQQLIVSVSHCGDPCTAERDLRALRKLRRPVHDGVIAQPYAKVQSSQDNLSPHGRSYYMTGGFVSRIEADMIEASLDNMKHSQAGASKISFTHMGGAIGRVRTDQTAYAGRTGLHNVVLRTSWGDRSVAQTRLQWGRDSWKTLEPFTQGFYGNLTQENGAQRVRGNYGENLPRLVELKTKVDPLNLFRLNPNIEPRAKSG